MGELEDKISGILGDPAQMDKISKMAESLFGGGSKSEKPASAPEGGFGDLLGGIDPEMLSKIGKVMSKQDGGKAALVKAMSPYLAPKRRDKMEKAVRFAQIARIAGIAFGERGGDENDK